MQQNSQPVSHRNSLSAPNIEVQTDAVIINDFTFPRYSIMSENSPPSFDSQINQNFNKLNDSQEFLIGEEQNKKKTYFSQQQSPQQSENLLQKNFKNYQPFQSSPITPQLGLQYQKYREKLKQSIEKESNVNINLRESLIKAKQKDLDDSFEDRIRRVAQFELISSENNKNGFNSNLAEEKDHNQSNILSCSNQNSFNQFQNQSIFEYKDVKFLLIYWNKIITKQKIHYLFR